MLHQQIQLFRLIRGILATSTTLLLSSCATIFNGGDPIVTIDGEIDEPVTIVTEAEVYKDVTLPVQVNVKRHGISGQHIHISSENHEFDDIVLQKKQTWWPLANYMTANLAGFFVDWATNSNVNPYYDYYLIVPKGEGEILRSNQSFRPDVFVSRPHANDFYRHELSISMGVSGSLESQFYNQVDRHVLSYGFVDGYTCLYSGEGLCLPLSIDYMYNINRRLAVGFALSRAHIGESKEQYFVESNPPFQVSYFCKACPESDGYYAAPSVRYKWWISPSYPISLYSQLSLGYAHTKFTVDEMRDMSGKILLPSYSNVKNQLGYHVTFAGMEMGRSHLRSFVEAGIGYKGYANIGLKYCF